MAAEGRHDQRGTGQVTPLVARALSTTARYRDVPEVRRLEAVGSPSHVIVHEIDGAEPAERDYCDAHAHPFGELNLVLGEPGALTFDIVLGDETREVTSPASVWIPAGVTHSANLRAGRGTFVVVYVSQPQPDPGSGG